MRKSIMFAIVPFVFLSCVTPVTKFHWRACEDICKDKNGVMEVCIEPIDGAGCHCENDETIYFELLETEKESKNSSYISDEIY